MIRFLGSFSARGEQRVRVQFGDRERELPSGRYLWTFGNGELGWGQYDDGSKQLALAMLLAATACENLSMQLAERMAFDWLSRLDDSVEFHANHQDVIDWVLMVIDEACRNGMSLHVGDANEEGIDDF